METKPPAGAEMLRARISRRDALRLGAIGAGALTLPSLLSACGSTSSTGSAGTATGSAPDPASLQAYDSNAKGGPETDLPKVFAFPGAFTDLASLALSAAMKEATEAAGFKYETAASNGDVAKSTSQMESMLARGFSATFMYPGNEPATRPLAQQALDAGACVFGGAGRPYSTCEITQDHAAAGRQIGRAAADWIRSNLDGRAKVAYFNEDSTPTIIPRHRAALAELKKVGPGVEVVSDIEVELNPEAGANAMSTILQAHPDVNVILGTAGALGGVYSVFDSKGKANDPDIYMVSVAGSDADLAKIAAGDTIYRATLASPWPIYGWAMGTFGADWQQGKSIPRLMSPPGGDILLDSPDAIRTFRDDMKDPQRTWETKRDTYVALWGNIDYTTRNTYWRTLANPPADA